MKDNENKIQLKPGDRPIKQKPRPIPYHLQSYVEKKTKQIISIRAPRKNTKCRRRLFLISGSNNREERQVKIALDSRKLNDSCMKMRPHLESIEELLNQILTEKTRVQKQPLVISESDLES